MDTEAVEYVPTIRERIRRRLFPYRLDFEERAEFQEKSHGKGAVVTVLYHFSFADRLRLLFGGRLISKVYVNCENDPGETEARTFEQIV